MAGANVHKSMIPNQRKLEKEETEVDFEIWKESMIFHISLDARSARFTSSGDLKSWNNTENRGFTNDGASQSDDTKMTAAAKASLLSIILSSIAYNAPVISWSFVTSQAKSLDEIWDRLRQRFGIKKTGARITELVDINREPGESIEALWERLSAFIEETLLVKDGAVQHGGVASTANESFTPTLLNIMVVLWLSKIHRDLPAAVRYRFATQLRTNTIYSCRIEIGDAIPVILSEIADKEANINRSGYNNRYTQSQRGRFSGQSGRFNQQGNFDSQAGRYTNPKLSSGPVYHKKRCCLCEAAGRQSDGHFLSACPFLPSEDKRYMSKVRDTITPDCDVELQEEEFEQLNLNSTSRRTGIPGIEVRRVDIEPSPVLTITVKSHKSEWTLDSGAETNLIEEAEARRLEVQILPTRHTATQADGKTPLITVGETHFNSFYGHHTFEFSGLVVKNLDTPVLAGVPFLKRNDVFVRYSINTIYIRDCCTVTYPTVKSSNPTNRRCTASVLRVPRKTCLLPGEEIGLPLPDELISKEAVALEPRSTNTKESTPNWFNCDIVTPIDGHIHIRNTSTEPILLEKHNQIAQVRPAVEAQPVIDVDYKPISPKKPVDGALYSSAIQFDPSRKLSPELTRRFHAIHKTYDSVFSPSIGCYNGKSGKFQHVINMSESLPPQRKGRVPQYKHSDLVTLQSKFDELFNEGILARPEDVNVPVEYVHPSFLVKKKSGGFRLVTNFGQMADYVKPQPTLMATVEDVIRLIGRWKYIIKTDCSSAYFQILLAAASRRYVGVVTPFRGTFVYCRSVMGLPGSESALEELLSRILGDLMANGAVAKLADDLYCGSDSMEELVDIWESMLSLLQFNNLKLSPGKTVILPSSTIILGWLWEDGTIRATPHRLNALMECDPPETVKALRSFVGAYNFVTRVLPYYSDKLDPLEQVISSSKTGKIEWTSELHECFTNAKQHLKEAKSVVLPRPDDQLYIITDAAVRCSGIASALYIVRNGQRRLAGYFNAKRKGHQITWLPCEVEALSIGCSIKHFSPYIIQSKHVTKLLTDNKPCVDAYKKLCRGQFSASPRVTTFLSIASRFRVEISHIPGSKNIFSDFISRHPMKCSGCQVCEFVHATEEAVVRAVTAKDILSGESQVPFTARSSWYQIQQSCDDLVKVQKYLKDGLTPSRKKRNITDIRRYLNVVKLSTVPNDGLLIIPANEPFKKSTQRIVIPRSVVDGLVMALHIQLQHPTKHQLKLIFSRAFFALDVHKSIDKVVDGCFQCAALKKVPSLFHQQTTSDPPATVGACFSTDVLRRYGQFILLLRESISSYSEATILSDEKAATLRDGLICLASKLRSPMSPPASVRTDGSTSFQALVADEVLSSHQIRVEIGDVKNINKNPISERGIEELHAEIVRIQPEGGKISPATLAVAVSNMNCRLRHNNLSALEVWTQREMTTGTQLNINDEQLIKDKISDRVQGHQYSAKYKARGKTSVHIPTISIGDLVFLYSDRSKLKEREMYLVVGLDDCHAYVQKFINQQLRLKKYRVKRSDIITVDSYPTTLPVPDDKELSDDTVFVPLSQDPLHAEDAVNAGERVGEEQNIPQQQDMIEEEDNQQQDIIEVSSEEEVIDEVYHPPRQVPVQPTAASERPRRQTAGKKPNRYDD